VSRSGTLTYEVVDQLRSSVMGNPPVWNRRRSHRGLSFVEVLELFEKDVETHAVVMIGEIGGSQEEEAAAFFQRVMTSRSSLHSRADSASERRMGHAGAIISGGVGGATERSGLLRLPG